MEWERAKTYILLFFVLLNIVLGGLLVLERRRYTVVPAREQAIIEIMERNNIYMDADIPRRFPPMRVMYVGGFCYDEYELAEIFFGTSDFQRLQQGNLFIHEYSELVISHGFVSYSNPFGHGEGLTAFTLAAVEALATHFVDARWPDFELDSVFEEPEMMRLTFRQVYRGYMIHSNFIEIFVKEQGIVQVELQFAEVLGIERDRQQIAASDEVLLTFVQRIRSHAQAAPVVITHMDLVFLQEEGSPDPEGRYRAEPFYRIFIAGDEGDPFLINAVSNEIIN